MQKHRWSQWLLTVKWFKIEQAEGSLQKFVPDWLSLQQLAIIAL